ncbi:MAG: hypothetical protein NC453_11490 [Muribaculum sp.]|nr:hypothetical protein [Muribaculum sp.]
MKKDLKKRLLQEVEECRDHIKDIYEPIDKVEAVGNLLKSIMEAVGVNEVLLASPFNDEVEMEDYSNLDALWTDYTIEDFIAMYKDKDLLHSNGFKVFPWYQPEWISMADIDTYPDRLTPDGPTANIVRIGIIDNVVKFTCQISIGDCAAGPLEDLPETEWLKLQNHIAPNRWLEIAEAIIKIDEILEYTKKYPGLHKLS